MTRLCNENGRHIRGVGRQARKYNHARQPPQLFASFGNVIGHRPKGQLRFAAFTRAAMQVNRGYRYADFDGFRVPRVNAFYPCDDSGALVQFDDAGAIRVFSIEAFLLHCGRTDGDACQCHEPAGAPRPRPPHFRVMTFRAHWTRRNERGPASAARRPHQFLFPEERFEPVIADRLRRQFLSPFKDRKRACAAGAAEVMCRTQAQVPVRHLSRAGLLPQLFPYLDQLRDTGRSHGMTLAFQPA